MLTTNMIYEVAKRDPDYAERLRHMSVEGAKRSMWQTYANAPLPAEWTMDAMAYLSLCIEHTPTIFTMTLYEKKQSRPLKKVDKIEKFVCPIGSHGCIYTHCGSEKCK